jgi:cell wall-associated NlpC family hydrolase
MRRFSATIALASPAFAGLIAFVGLTGCSASLPRERPAHTLVLRAWAGREPPTTARGATAARFAWGQVGKRYCWGGVGPSCFDCSGLVQRAWRSAGVAVPRTADRIASGISEVPLSEVRAGDILWWPGHVGIYVGNGWMVDALDTPHGVVMRPAADPRRALRPAEGSDDTQRASR